MAIANVDNPGEVWRDVPGYEALYQVSDHGRVRSKVRTYTIKGRFFTKRPILMKASINKAGYPQISLHMDSKTTSRTVHQLVAWAFLGEQLAGIQVNHIDGDKTNNHLHNLEYITHKANIRHARDTGLMNNKRRYSHCKLSDEQVREIRALCLSGVPHKDIAVVYDYPSYGISRINKGIMYSWVV